MTEGTPVQPAPQGSTGIGRWQRPALIVGILGAIVCVVAWVQDAPGFYRGYLPAYVFWFQIAAGSLGVLMLQYITGGEWGIMIRRPLGAAARTMVWMAVLFLPIAAGMHHLYPWTHHDVVAHDPVLKLKTAYLNTPGFLVRTGIYFAIWIIWGWAIRRLSLRFYEDRAPETDLKRRGWAASGLVLFALTMSFTGIDWLMSLEPKWMSSMYGINFLISAGLAAFAFVTFFLTRISDTPAMADIVRPNHFRDLGNLMLAFTMLWAYTQFSEYLLIWYANMKEETPHFLVRQVGVWGFIAVLLIVFHFFLPFGMLLMRAIKDRASTIGTVAIIILIARFIGIYWLTEPAFSGAHFHFSWAVLPALAAVGGLWLFLFIGQLKGQSIIPIHETWVEEALREGAAKKHA